MDHITVTGYDHYHAYTSKQQVLDHSPVASDNLPGQVLNYFEIGAKYNKSYEQ